VLGGKNIFFLIRIELGGKYIFFLARIELGGKTIYLGGKNIIPLNYRPFLFTFL
jgi:hypothetical protein